MSQVIIKNTLYFDKEEDRILKPCFSGEYWMVDCDKFYKKEDLIEIYGKEYIDEDHFEEYDDQKYYYAETSPARFTEPKELISDISNVSL